MKCITVNYLGRSELLDISTEDKLRESAKKITNLILKRIQPLYTVILTNLYDLNFENTDLYDTVNDDIRKYIFENVSEYIHENEIIDIEGFIIFRLKNIWEITERAAEEYINIKNEYDCLIGFLSDFTQNTPNICDTIKVVAHEGNYSVYDENMAIMAYVKSYDDTLLDIILNIAPQKIYIYNKEFFTSKSLLDNICAIFKDKVVFSE